MTSLVWFRNDLRINDNQSLERASLYDKTIAVYIFDSSHYVLGEFGFKKTECFRAKFLIETIQDMRKSLDALNITLLVHFDRPEKCLPQIIKEHQIDTVYLQKEWTRDENQQLLKVKTNCTTKVHFIESYDQFLYHPDDIPFKNFDAIPSVFTQFRKQCEKQVAVRSICARPQKKDRSNKLASENHIPSLMDLGFNAHQIDDRTAFPFLGGETSALDRLHDYLWQTKKVANYKKTRNGLIGVDYSTKLSPWLANGSISAKAVYWQIKQFEQKVVKNQDTYWVIFELLWRDYFKYISLKHGDDIFKIDGILKTSYKWDNDHKTLQSWINGKTAESFVNANMIELSLTGWMSNRGRQNVASYWSKQLKQDWRIGASYFESMLIDYDVHSNWGNWMYNSGVGNDPRNRTFNIKTQAERYDPHGKYQKLWLQQRLF